MKPRNSNLTVDQKLDSIIYGPDINNRNGNLAYDALYAGKPFDIRNRDAVKMAQRVLVFLDILPSSSAVTGIYEGPTQSGIRFFQQLHGLRPATGELTAATATALHAKVGKAVAALTPQQVKAQAEKLGPSSASKPSAEGLVNDPRVKAMLDTLTYAEGTKAGYGTIAFGEVMESPLYPEYVGQKNVALYGFRGGLIRQFD